MASLGLWRLLRNPYGRRAYEALKDAGVTATRMYEYVGSTADPPSATPPQGVAVAARDPGTLSAATWADFAALRAGDVAVVATAGDRARSVTDGQAGGGAAGDGDDGGDGEVVGYLFLSDRPVTVDALAAEYEFDGCYVWRVFVAPPHRERGVASALLARALARAREEGHATAHALVAADNRPSQWLFEGAGFERRRRHTYARVRRWEYRDVTDLGDGRP
jgi:ribosomal protein S18 acetylase RimI-like enzyme